jgi:lycopene cyclase domain-containing protein
LNSHYTYFFILAAALAGPFVLSFDKKVAFYTKWKYLFPAMLLPAIIYITWDSLFTSRAVWSFNPEYVIGSKIAGLPIEEILFFFVVPYCCVFIYECMLVYFPGIKNNAFSDNILKLLSAILFITGVIYLKQDYTSWTFILFSIFVGLFYGFRKYFTGFKTGVFLVSYVIILVPFLLINGFLTAIPVVIYNDAENLGLRIYTIPLKMFFTGCLLVFMNLVIYEKLRTEY